MSTSAAVIARARARKAASIAGVLIGQRCSAADALVLSLHGRAVAAEIAGVAAPSTETWALVVELLAGHEAFAAARLHTATEVGG